MIGLNECKTRRELAIDDDMRIVGAKLKLVENRLDLIEDTSDIEYIRIHLRVLKKCLNEAQFSLDIPDYFPSVEKNSTDD